MKKILIFLLFSIFILNSCKKDGINPINTDTIPSPPTLLSPADTATGVAVPTTFSWNTIANADSFTLQVSLSSSLDNPVFNKGGLTGTNQEVTGLSNLTVYYWRVSATNKFGTSDWSTTRSFTTSGPLSSIPTLLSPANGSTNISTPPTLSWNTSSGTTSFTLQLSKNSSFTSFEYNQSGLLSTSQQVTGLSNLTLYYWRVSATNNYGTSGWSNTRSFTTSGPHPEIPVLSSPANNLTDVSIPSIVNWNASSGATSYTLQVSTSNSFTSFVYNQNGLTGTSQQVSGLSNLTLYYWRVSATNSFGTSSWSSIWSFTTIDTAPVIPTLLSPANNATNIAISPTLSWSASSGALSNTLQVSTSNSFTSFIYNQNGLTGTSQLVSGLSSLTLYYWRVSATNKYGTSSYSTVWNFTTSVAITPCPGIPTVTYSGKTYNTVQIGTQCWLRENLDVGTRINGSANQTDNGTIEKYCYNDDSANCTTYGGLYQWNEAMQYVTTPGTQGICPTGWHVPTYVEFQTLITTVSNDGNALKAVGQGTGSGVGTNTSGFSALLAGLHLYYSNFYWLGYVTYFWSSTEGNATDAYSMDLNNASFDAREKDSGLSVRCLKD
jgi:uncharacterized protein (TIGR02145 family)